MLKTVLLTSLVFTVPIAVVRSLGGFEGLELAAYDDFLRRRPVEQLDEHITIVTISDDDIEHLQQYPIQDGTLAKALQTLESYQPRAIGLDISRDVPHGPPAGRKRLTEVIGSSKTIVSGCLLSNKEYAGSPPAPGTPEGGAAFTDLPTDADTTVRRTRVVSTPGKTDKPIRVKHVCNDARPENEIYSLSFELARLYLETRNINAEPNENGEIKFSKQVLQRISPNFGNYIRADATDYQMMLNYRGANPVFRSVSISDVLKNNLNRDWVRDRIILIGSSSEVSKDFLETPYLQTQLGLRNMHGVVVHAHAVSQILNAVLENRPLIHSWSEPGEILWMWVWALGSGLIAFYNRRLGLFIIGLIGTTAALGGICYGLFFTQGLWIPIVPTLLGALFTALGVRLSDLAKRSGYGQAVYEHLQEQMKSGSGGSRDHKGDYLESLVQRARRARLGDAASSLSSTGAELDATATPEMKALYEQMRAKVQQEMDAEQLRQKKVMVQSRPGDSKASRLQALLNRAQRSRSQLDVTVDPIAAYSKPENPNA